MPRAGLKTSLAVARLTPRWLLYPALLWMAVFLVLPLLMLAALSLARRGDAGQILWDLTLKNYASLAEPWMGTILLRSAWVALQTTFLCLLLGYPFALIAAWAPPRRQRWLLLFISLPLWTNLILRLYAFVILLRSDGWVNAALQALGIIEQPLALLYTPGATALGMVYHFLPFAIMPLFSAASRIDKSLVEAARDLGAGAFTVLVKVLWPLTLPGLFAAVLLTFIPCMSLFVVADFLGGGRTMLLGNWIEHQFLAARDWPAGAAMAVVLLLAPGLLWWAGKRVLRFAGATGQERLDEVLG